MNKKIFFKREIIDSFTLILFASCVPVIIFDSTLLTPAATRPVETSSQKENHQNTETTWTENYILPNYRHTFINIKTFYAKLFYRGLGRFFVFLWGCKKCIEVMYLKMSRKGFQTFVSINNVYLKMYVFSCKTYF